MRIAPLTCDHHEAWADLLAAVFAHQPSEMLQLISFLQAAAPLVAYGVWDDKRLAAQYSCLLRQVHVPDQPEPVVVGMSVNMAVHPDYRGQGLVKKVAGPVYTAVQAQGAVAGVGFSNADGVKVDRRSKGYGYQVVGRLASVVALLKRPLPLPPLTLSPHWPTQLPAFAPANKSSCYHFIASAQWLAQRFAAHPFRRYHFGVGESGIVVYRPFRWHGYQGASLLAAYGPDLATLLGQWTAALWQNSIRLIHLLASPVASLLRSLRATAVCLRLPYSRQPYYLTAKPLSPHTPANLFSLAQWDCTGGDVL